MKKEKDEIRDIFVKTRMNKKEYDQLQRLQRRTTDTSLSNYIRKVLLQKAVTIKYRNSSADDFLNDMLQLKKELHAIGNNYNQAVHKLHILEKIPEFRNWIISTEQLRRSFFEKVDQIHTAINQLYEQWLPK